LPIEVAMPDQPRPDAAESLYVRATAAQAAGRYEEAVRLLWQASQEGDVNAMTLLGGQLLSGRGAPPDPPTGARLIVEAASKGGAYACSLASAIVASGLYGPPDWERALDFLQRSAELGHSPAQGQLKVLARAGDVRSDPSAWSRLRRSVDVKRWRASPPARALTPDGGVKVLEGFAAADVCDWIIAGARGRLKPAMTFDTAALRPVQSEVRTNSAAGFELINIDLVVLLIRERLAAACGGSPAAMEAPQVLHYAPGQQFAPHYDFLEPEFAGHAEDLARRGQRAVTLLVYLNEGFEGGETDFPHLGLRFKGRRGDALMFTNVDGTGNPDRRMLHAGLPPTAGEKWLLSQWVRDRAPPQRGPVLRPPS
jgi:prolyl 4-hydroxylase